jgi:transposase
LAIGARANACSRSGHGPRWATGAEASPPIYEGATRTEAAKIGGMTQQIVRDWVLKFNTYGPEQLLNRKAASQPPRLKDEHRTALTRMIESRPISAIHGIVHWRLIDLCEWVIEESRIHVARRR